MKRITRKGTILLVGLMGVVVVLIILYFNMANVRSTMEIRDAAFKSRLQPGKTVYIKEYTSEDEYEYQPYNVVTSNYNGDVLLLRKYVDAVYLPYNIGLSWDHQDVTTGDASNYYKDSNVDVYLNTEFINRYSNGVQNNILTTDIKITSEDARKVETISRKLFLLSLSEIFGDTGIALDEGRRLLFFRVNGAKATEDDGKTRAPYITRSRDERPTSEYIMTVGRSGGFDCFDPGNDCGIRPAFCVPTDTKIKLSEEVKSGKRVYVLECDEAKDFGIACKDVEE